MTRPIPREAVEKLRQQHADELARSIPLVANAHTYEGGQLAVAVATREEKFINELDSIIKLLSEQPNA